MTNTLHRLGDSDSFKDDYVIFAIASRGRNDEGCLERLRAFLRLAVRFQPVNMGDAGHGGAIRPCGSLSPMSHWRRDMTPDFETVILELDAPCTVAAVFDNRQAAEGFMRAVKDANLGLSVNISTSIERATECCRAVGLHRHSVGYSLGFEGRTERLPSREILMLSTMCGHGMIAASLAGKMLNWVKEGRRTPDQAATYLARFCSCGVFNPSRARRIFEEARSGAI